MSMTPFTRRMKEDGSGPISFPNEKGHVFAYVYDAPAAHTDGEPAGPGAKHACQIICGPTTTSNDGTVVEVWSGTAGRILDDVNLSAFYNRFRVAGAGRQSIVADSPLDAWVQEEIQPA